MTQAHISTLALLIGGVVLVGTAYALERYEPELWTARLALPSFDEQVNKHTPRFTEGTWLPPVIAENMTLSPDNNPVLVDHTRIAPGVTVTLLPGTTVAFKEFGRLVVAGNLESAGSATRPVTFITNETHSENIFWGGVEFVSGSTGTIAYTTIEDGSPAVSCLPGSTVTITDSTLQRASMGIFMNSPTCSVYRSRIQGVRDGVVAVGVVPQVVATEIAAAREAIKEIPQ